MYSMGPVNSNLIFYSHFFMALLFGWSLIWAGLSIYRISHNSSNKLFWQVNLIWSFVNIAIASISLYTTAKIDVFTVDRAVTMRNIVALNIALDFVYIITAALLRKSANVSKQQIGSAVLLQGLFLLALDITIVAVFHKAIS